jgi:regulator of sigma E protease
MVPRLRIKAVDSKVNLRSGDIILAVGDIENPTYKEIRDVTTEYEKKELPIKVLRAGPNGVEDTLTVTVVPKRSQDGERVVIGIFPVFDAEHAVVAKTIATEDRLAALAIPRGAAITAVNGIEVSNFYDCLREIHKNAGRHITIDYRLDEEISGSVVLDVGDDKAFITVKSAFAEYVPFEDLKRLYKASGPIDAVVMGYKKTIMFIAQTYVSIRRLIGGLVSRRELSGPVGIIAMTYRIAAEQPLIYYVYFLGIISVLLAVFNFLPLLPFDGGHIVLLLVEKVKGSALSERTQGIIAYAGVVFIIVLFLYLTLNDIVNIFFS